MIILSKFISDGLALLLVLNLPISGNIIVIYIPTPPLGQDMTQGQFLSGV